MSKKYDFTAYRVNTDEDKASPILEHDYKPIDDDPDIVLRCRHFRAGEKMTYASLKPVKGATGEVKATASFDYRAIILNQVDSISGLVLTVTDDKTGKPKDIEVKDAETLIAFPDAGVVHDIVNNTAIHLISADSLTEAEQGN